VYRPVTADLMSLSPKLANSLPKEHSAWRGRHARDQHRPDVLRRLMTEYAYQLKFVIDTPEDVTEVVEYLAQFPKVPPEQVWLMPQGVQPETLAEKEVWLAPLAAQWGFRYCPRKHIELFGNVRGT
jgi:7-carboxy-7-deazaguanine synthase